jgi:hypothetical protein
MNAIFRFALIVSLSAASCVAQTGSVTFYSQRLTPKSEATMFLPKSQQPFEGWLFDGPQRLARLNHGRLATFKLKPGIHSFTVTGPTGPGKRPLVINVEDGGQYCVRLFAKVINVGVYGRWENQIKGVPCHGAQGEAAHLKPVEMKRVDPATRAEFDPATTFQAESPPQR